MSKAASHTLNFQRFGTRIKQFVLLAKVFTRTYLWLAIELSRVACYLFTRHIRPLILVLSQSMIECIIGGLFVYVFAYAADMVLLAQLWHVMNKE